MECPNCGHDNFHVSRKTGLAICQNCGHKAHPEAFRTTARIAGEE